VEEISLEVILEALLELVTLELEEDVLPVELVMKLTLEQDINNKEESKIINLDFFISIKSHFLCD
jgi:hypothetical protein